MLKSFPMDFILQLFYHYYFYCSLVKESVLTPVRQFWMGREELYRTALCVLSNLVLAIGVQSEG